MNCKAFCLSPSRDENSKNSSMIEEAAATLSCTFLSCPYTDFLAIASTI